MSIRWYEEQAPEEWLSDITVKDYEEVYKILCHSILRRQAARCMALQEGFHQSSDFKQRVEHTVKSHDLSLDAALFLVYQEAMTEEAAQELLTRLQKQADIALSESEVPNPPSLSLDLIPPIERSSKNIKYRI